MSDVKLSFKDAFWETDFFSQTGFETLSNHIKAGQKLCKWLEDYLKQRAKAEDDYAKALSKIAKNAFNPVGPFGSFLCEFRSELEAESNLHATVASKFIEETTKLTEFRDTQREERKKNEDAMHKAHKSKWDSHRHMSHCKQTCLARVKAAEKAKSDVEKSKATGTKAKEIEKVNKQFANCDQQAKKANAAYKVSVSALEEARQYWEQQHIIVCEDYQQMELERIRNMRNTIWVFSNLTSDLCCELDENRERIRVAAENCDEDADLQEFVVRNGTCSSPLKPILYEPPSWFSTTNNTNSQQPINNPPTEAVYAEVRTNNKPPTNINQPSTNSNQPSTDNNQPSTNNNEQSINDTHENESQSSHDIDYENIWDEDESGLELYSTYLVLYDYTPQSSDELELKVGDSVRITEKVEKGWMKALNLSTNKTGLVPVNYLKK